MDALYINIASRLAKIKSGQNDDGFSYIGRPSELRTASYWRAVFAEFFATMFFVICGVSSTVDLPDDGAALVKVWIRYYGFFYKLRKQGGGINLTCTT